MLIHTMSEAAGLSVEKVLIKRHETWVEGVDRKKCNQLKPK
jgi:hypothetical protein